ncbi:hypothetical protein QPB17_002003 [Vibrio cholerae]|uniref:hypothetical protein n=1 Tax=Vibrio owensii TaxID=696485 RepID=UPI0003A82538|nr:hypothetical protein [Vibrio owensii]ELP4887184.1 hypothetical protein [Vibrio cholerae]ELT8460444.1 hypothetical protein [Vibrio cholerae]
MYEEYQSHSEIDFSRIYHVFHSLPLFDDTYLNMQGMNIGMVDMYITGCEYELLNTYIEIEKTPVDMAMFTSAQSQMWIFALYELMRTWKQRMRQLRKWKDNGALNQMLAKVQKDEHNLAAYMRGRHIEWVRDEPSAIDKLDAYENALKPLYDMTSSIRMNLAKHEIQGKNNSIVRAPGYGRINMLCGALDYQVDIDHETFEFVNRRDIADAIRRIQLPS